MAWSISFTGPRDAGPVWMTVPNVTFVLGVASTYDLSPYWPTIPPGSEFAASVVTALPTGVTLDGPHKLLIYDGGGAPGTLTGEKVRLTDSTDDWATRSAGVNVVKAVRFNTLAEVNLYDAGGGPERNAEFDTTIKPTGADGSLRFRVLNADTTQSGEVKVPFGVDFVNGDTFYVQYRVRMPAAHAYQPWPSSDGQTTGYKTSIISHVSSSNQPWEFVIQTIANSGIINGYWQDGNVSAVPWEQLFNGSDFKWQPEVDHGANPLTGTNPDTGSAWTSAEQTRAEFGGTYVGASAADFRVGIGDPISGGIRHEPDVWVTILQKIVVGTFGGGGGADSHGTVWAAMPNQGYQKLFDGAIQLGGTGPYNAVWLLPYCSRRIAGGVQVTARSNAIPGVTPLSLGLGTPQGTANIRFTRSTMRLDFKGSGESYGTPRGATGLRNLISSTNSTSYVAVKVDPFLLPLTDQTESFTVANGRPDTQLNYCELIVSRSAINAPGGYAPT